MNVIAKLKGKKRWTMKKEVKALESNIKTLAVDDKLYAPSLDSIEKMSRIQNSKMETRVKIFKEVGTLVICGAVALIAYSVDKSDEIPRNKNSMNLFTRIFRF